MKEKSRSTEIKIVVDAKDNNIDCVATVNVGSIDLDTTIELLQICIDELTKKKMEGEISMIDHNAQGWRLNTWKEVKEVIVEAMQKGNMFISEADVNNYYFSDTDRLAQAQTETAISYMEQQIFDGLRVYYSKVDPTKTEEDWKDFYYETADAMFTGTNQFLHMRLFYFVYIPNESRVMIIYSAPFDFFDDTIMEHEFERE